MFFLFLRFSVFAWSDVCFYCSSSICEIWWALPASSQKTLIFDGFLRDMMTPETNLVNLCQHQHCGKKIIIQPNTSRKTAPTWLPQDIEKRSKTFQEKFQGILGFIFSSFTFPVAPYMLLPNNCKGEKWLTRTEEMMEMAGSGTSPYIWPGFEHFKTSVSFLITSCCDEKPSTVCRKTNMRARFQLLLKSINTPVN